MNKNADRHNILPPELAGMIAVPAAPYPQDADTFIGTSAVMLDLYARIESAARSRAPVMITGEPGTGKMLCARTLHRRSINAAGPFIVAGGADTLLTEETFAHAAESTVLLSDITNFSATAQHNLLQLLRDGAADRHGARLLSAAAEDPRTAIRMGRLRADLFHRLNVVPLFMPPLRMRGEDIVDLAHIFLRRAAVEEGAKLQGFDPAAENLLRAAPWPGNVRQLVNVMRALAVTSAGTGETTAPVNAAMLTPLLRPDEGSRAGTPDTGHPVNAVRPLATVEREAVETAIRLCGGNIPLAAKRLEISASTLYRKRAAWNTRRRP